MDTKKPDPTKYISQKAAIGALLGSAIWAGLLMYTASTTMTPSFRGTYEMMFGPLVVNRFTAETAAEGDRIITVGFTSGFLVYIALWICLGAGIGYLLLYKRGSKIK